MFEDIKHPPKKGNRKCVTEGPGAPGPMPAMMRRAESFSNAQQKRTHRDRSITLFGLYETDDSEIQYRYS